MTLHIALSADNAEFSKDAAHSEGVVPGNLRPVLGTCHSLSVIGDDICGDPMDIISQQASGLVDLIFYFMKLVFEMILVSRIATINMENIVKLSC